MKTIMVFSYSMDDWIGYQNVLEEMFSETDVCFKAYNLNDREFPLDHVVAAMISAIEFADYVRRFLPPQVPVIWVNHTIDKAIYCQLEAICVDRKLSIVADSLYYTESRKRMLINLGLPARRLCSWYHRMEEKELEEYVIAFEGTEIPGRERRHVIDIDCRGLIAIDTLLKLFSVIGRLDLCMSDTFKRYQERVRFNVRQPADMLDIGSFYIKDKENIVRNGFVMFTHQGILYYCDMNALTLLGKQTEQVLGHSIYQVFPALRAYDKDIWNGRIASLGERIIKYENRQLVLNIWTSITHQMLNGYMTICDYNSETNYELRLRRQKIGKKHKAKYSFQQISGNSEIIQRCRQIAENMARSDGTVLITGPSGCGKELFAQAIHNASRRKDMPFISVNCGALMESLLESELFGYSGGSFTGARKEGKAGLFELAHRGTLFLDEIGEMPLSFQVKLLRVLQEREVVRVGGDEVIPIDVRIIAATNRDLHQMVKEGAFRLDLYYRLNVLPLKLCGLNERREDILPLFNSMMRERGYDLQLDEETMGIIREHYYEGNVRELQNCLEYLESLGKTKIKASDLPEYMSERLVIDKSPAVTDGSRAGKEPGREKPQTELILWAIGEINQTGIGAGRRSIYSFLMEHDRKLSEVRIRELLKEMDDKVEIKQGRRGIWLKTLNKE